MEGKENIVEGGVIFAANHVSNAEGVLLNSIRYRPIRFLGKEELFKTPIGRIINGGLGTIPIKRGKSDNEALIKAVDALKEGKRIGIFPEGTRGNGKELGKPHTGVIRLALMADVPIIPVGISGGSRAWPRGKSPKLFRKVYVRIGEPWYVPKPAGGREFSYEELRELSEYLLYQLIEPLWDKTREAP